jgi:hypothetical protein
LCLRCIFSNLLAQGFCRSRPASVLIVMEGAPKDVHLLAD